MITIIFCPKCKSQKVETERMTPPAPPLMVSMDELAERSGIIAVPAVMHRSQWRATCKDCGYFVEYYA